MLQQVYKYGLFYQIVRNIFITMIIWLPVYLFMDSLVKHSWDFSFLKSPYYLFSLVLITFVSGYNGIVLGHAFSNMKTDESGIDVKYFWKYIQIPWDKITFKSSVVQSDALPSLYYGQGLLFRLSFRKIVFIFPNISNYKELISEISEHTKNNKR